MLRRLSLLPLCRSTMAKPMHTKSHVVAVDKADNTITFTPKTGHSASLVFMHGLGDTAFGWADTMQFMSESMPHVKCILPTAQTQPVTLNHGMQCPSWYDIQSLSNRKGDPCTGIEASRDRILQIIEKEIDAGIAPSRIVLGGFSQGGALSLFTGYQMNHALAGILVLSAYVPKADRFAVPEALKEVPLLMCHGDSDMVVQLSWAEMSVGKVKDQGVKNVEFIVYEDLDHGASMEEITKVKTWLQKVLPATA
ncbi:acyl-protein thioesterase [Achlya hypogyna]|uniref:Acyl-protein thioesterase n=1 Tax=Achlya hypogyna TaxID=1202772 RepID=A0A1V9YAZ1_ACHHY|nr:acyl-protein thioesterase [Achlya hypogyna]